MDQVPGCPLYSIENKFGVGGPGAGPLGGPLASCTCSGDSASCAIIARALIVILCNFL